MKREKRKYSSFSNLCFIYKDLWKFDKSTIIYAVLEVITRVISNFILILLPAAVIRMLEMELSVKDMAGRLLLIFALYGIISGADAYLLRRNRNQYIVYRGGHLSRLVCKKAMSIDYVQYEGEDNQKLVQKAVEDGIGSNDIGVEGILHKMVLATIGILGLFLYMVLISNVNYFIIVMLLVISVIQYFCYGFASRYEYSNKEKKAELEVTKGYFDKQAYDVSAGKDIRLYQLQGWLSKKYQEANKKYQSIIGKERVRYFANDLVGLLLQLLRDGICYIYLIGLLKDGMEVSYFVFYIGLIGSFSIQFNEITHYIMEMGRYQKSVDFLREFLDLKTIFHHGDGERLREDEKAIEIEFSHVFFSYPKKNLSSQEDLASQESSYFQENAFLKNNTASENKKVAEDGNILDDISFKIKQGEKLALVGINGAGKTTIVKLICGFYRPTKGHIYINGIDIEHLDLDDYYKYLAVVFQEAFLPSFSIEENITCLNLEDSNYELCKEVLIKAGLWEKVDSLPKKTKTYINKDIEEDGIGLSGGEVQKLMLGRALYKNCKLLLLDEPTAALDALAENEIYQKYEEVIAGKTALFISHRLASTRFCDKILFLEHGKIAEEGTHDQLMKEEGAYAHMFKVQSKYYKEEGGTDESKILFE